MEQSNLNWITGYIWGIADDVLRDLYVRGKYRDVILPMTVLRRLDAVLEGAKQEVLDMKNSLDKAGVVEQEQALRQAAGQAFYNTSKFTMRDLKARASQQQLKADFEAYLDGFSLNVQSILDNFGDEIEAHVHGDKSAASQELVASIIDIDGSVAALDETHRDKQPDWTFGPRWSGKSPADRFSTVASPGRSSGTHEGTS